MVNTEIEMRNLEFRRRELLREARLQMLADEARRGNPRLQARLLALLSDLMIASGTRLQALAARPPDLEGGYPEWIGHL